MMVKHPLTALFLAASLAIGTAEDAAGQSPEPRFGADDEIGAANFLTPDVVRQAAALVQTGQTYQLGVVVTEETLGPGGRLAINTMLPLQATEDQLFVDDYLAGHLSVGTQIDGLGHAAVNGRVYNDVPVAEIMGLNGIARFGVETIPPIATRGVVLDIAAVRGVEAMQPGDAITVADIEAAMA